MPTSMAEIKEGLKKVEERLDFIRGLVNNYIRYEDPIPPGVLEVENHLHADRLRLISHLSGVKKDD